METIHIEEDESSGHFLSNTYLSDCCVKRVRRTPQGGTQGHPSDNNARAKEKEDLAPIRRFGRVYCTVDTTFFLQCSRCDVV